MSEDAKKTRREYMRAWRQKNKDKLKSAQQRYWEKKSKEQKEEL